MNLSRTQGLIIHPRIIKRLKAAMMMKLKVSKSINSFIIVDLNFFKFAFYLENSKGFIMDDEYSSNNSNNNLNIPVGMNNFANQFISNNSNNSLNGSTNNVSRSIEG